jgi:DNA adenine methylase
MSAPPFAYYGGKTRIADQIVAALPVHRCYVEPFAGSCAVLLAKPRARMETVNDINGELVTFWRVLRDQPRELIRACALTPHSRGEYEASKSRPRHLDELEIARRVWVKLAQGRSGTLRNTGWRHYLDPQGSSISMPAYLDSYVERMAVVTERLAGVSIESRPALQVIAAYGQHPETVLYVDPPYLAETRNGRNYADEMATPEEHAELAEALLECKASVVLSGYDSPQYADLYAGWHVMRISTYSGQGGSGGGRTEVLWSNRLPEPDLFGGAA